MINMRGPAIMIGDLNTILHNEDRVARNPIKEVETRDLKVHAKQWYNGNEDSG